MTLFARTVLLPTPANSALVSVSPTNKENVNFHAKIAMITSLRVAKNVYGIFNANNVSQATPKFTALFAKEIVLTPIAKTAALITTFAIVVNQALRSTTIVSSTERPSTVLRQNAALSFV